MERLISMTEFVLQQRMSSKEINEASFYDVQTHIFRYYDKVFAYANFLKQTLTLGMFVPCDEEGYIIPKPTPLMYHLAETGNKIHQLDIQQWEAAKEKVLFEGFEFFELNKGEINGYVKHVKIDLVYSFPNHRNYTIEELVSYGLELTPSALKLIGL